VNIDHAATFRNARGTSYPNPLRAAEIAINAGANFITAHLREDRRHIIPEKREELTTEGGLDIFNIYSKLSSIIEKMHSSDIKVSQFIDPNINQLKYLEKLKMKPDTIEIHTGNYCYNPLEKKLQLIINATEYINKLGIECHAGHGITYKQSQCCLCS
ncbi:Pyridoxine 5'-phosphate synthase, partial [Armadillidium nasatum]